MVYDQDYTETRTKLSLTLHLANLTIIPSSGFLRKWSDEADAFTKTDWNIFRDSSDGIEEYTTSVTGFLNKCIDEVVPTVTIRTYPKQKPWITGNICTELKGRAATFMEWDSNLETYKKSC
jgi:hypothetical protein